MTPNLTPEQQKILIEAQQIEEESNHFQQQLSLLDQNILELNSFQEALFSMSKEKENLILAPLGRGVFMKAQRYPEESLFVEVGAGIVVRKSLEDTKKLVSLQLSQLGEARLSLISHISQVNNRMIHLVSKLRSTKKE